MSRDILLNLIDPDPDQPRKVFDEDQLRGLAESLDTTGQAVAITVRPVGERYTIVTGERRWRAAQWLGWATIRAEVLELDPATSGWLTLVENIQRADLTPIEEAQAYQKLIAAGYTQTEIGAKVGKGQSYVASKLRLLRLPRAVQDLLAADALTEGHCKQLLRLAYPGYITDKTLEHFATEAVAAGWSVKRLTLEVNYHQMVDDGYFLMPIDERWTFKDLVQLEKEFAPGSPTADVERHLRVQRRLGMILTWLLRVNDAGAANIMKMMVEDTSLADTYWWTKQCAEWERKFAHRDVELPAYLRYAWLGSVSDVVHDRVHAMLAAVPDEVDDQTHAELVWSGMANVIRCIDQDFDALLDALPGSAAPTPA